jgi:hypothetical protein
VCAAIVVVGITIVANAYRSTEQYTRVDHRPERFAVVVLARGFDETQEYDPLIQRNRSIAELFYAPQKNKASYDIIIFHEGNIAPHHREYLQSQTPHMPLEFREVQFIYPDLVSNAHTTCEYTEATTDFTMGYRNMCRFWSVLFLDHLKDYAYIFRIDDDCVLRNVDPNVMQRYSGEKDGTVFSSPMFMGPDVDAFVVGLHELIQKHVPNELPVRVRNPYTNVMIVDVAYFRARTDIRACLREIDASNCIFINRWGDLPIWGWILAGFVDANRVSEDLTIRYYHGSHDIEIDGGYGAA